MRTAHFALCIEPTGNCRNPSPKGGPVSGACVCMALVSSISARNLRAAKLVVLLSDCERESGSSWGGGGALERVRERRKEGDMGRSGQIGGGGKRGVLM
jgi:hypothetical protein